MCWYAVSGRPASSGTEANAKANFVAATRPQPGQVLARPMGLTASPAVNRYQYQRAGSKRESST